LSVIKTPEQVEMMRLSGALLGRCLNLLVCASQPGRTAVFVNDLAEEFIQDHGAVPAFKNYSGGGPYSFPASICFSRNNVLVHGIPTPEIIIEEGDIITIDCGLSLNGWFADAARLFGVGEISEEDSHMIQASENVLHAGIEACVVGNKLGGVQRALQSAIADSGYYNVYQFCGHAIGKKMHEEPQVPNFGQPNKGIDLKPGMVFCLEPMLRKHRHTELGILPDKWTVVTTDGSRTTHIEHMVLVTEDRPEILTE